MFWRGGGRQQTGSPPPGRRPRPRLSRRRRRRRRAAAPSAAHPPRCRAPPSPSPPPFCGRGRPRLPSQPLSRRRVPLRGPGWPPPLRRTQLQLRAPAPPLPLPSQVGALGALPARQHPVPRRRPPHPLVRAAFGPCYRRPRLPQQTQQPPAAPRPQQSQPPPWLLPPWRLWACRLPPWRLWACRLPPWQGTPRACQGGRARGPVQGPGSGLGRLWDLPADRGTSLWRAAAGRAVRGQAAAPAPSPPLKQDRRPCLTGFVGPMQRPAAEPHP
jgi:hypothetical protein